MPGNNSQQGFSLIELMIAITLGVVMMGAALQFMVGTTRTYDLGDDISRIQENGRIALDILVKDAENAAHLTSLIPRRRNFFLMDCSGTGANACLRDDTQLVSSSSDRLAVQYTPYPDDGTEVDCLGTTIPAGTLLVNVYTIDDIDGDGINSLYCQGFNASTNAWLSAAPQPLVDGIDQMQLLYRVTTPAAGPTGNDSYRYISGDQLTAAMYPFITAVRIGLLVSNGQVAGAADNLARSYRVLDGNQLDITDNHMRRIYSTTVQFNNHTGGS